MILTGRHRVVQIHPTLRCNLRCLHCYSSSGPNVETCIEPDIACTAVGDAAACGYEVLAVSGGEPLLYEGLIPLLSAARTAGMGTALTSNGTTLSPTRLADLSGRLDLLTISVDGVPASHDRIRNRRGAFALLQHRLAAVRDSGIRFGFIFTLTQHNVHELEWVAQFAVEQGATLLQIHPLEMAGRASFGLHDAHPDCIELGFAFAEALRLRQQFGDRLLVHVDIATRAGFDQIADSGDVDAVTRLADMVSPLVIEADGTVVPLSYGFPRQFALGTLHDAALPELERRWLTNGHEALRSALTGLRSDDAWPDKLPVVNIYEAAVEIASHTSRRPVATAADERL